MLRDCVVLAIEGTHASGKTTLVHGLAAHYRERGIHVATVEEPARGSPFIEEIVVHGKGRFDVGCEAEAAMRLAAVELPSCFSASATASVIGGSAQAGWITARQFGRSTCTWLGRF